jgi:uncharacterized surface protein with fasciclin (FAS1) repeats
LLGGFPDLVSALAAATNITILAPSNDAIATLLNSDEGKALAGDTGLVKAVLQYHVLSGVYPASAIKSTPAFVPSLLTNTSFTNVTGGQRVEAILSGSNVEFVSGLLRNSSVVKADVNFNGGVIHVIDEVLTVPESASKTANAAGLTSLYGALKAAKLVDTVDGLGNVTIFAPSNAAFQAIGSGLGSLSTADLTSILTYHVVVSDQPLYSSTLKNGTSVKTVNGGEVTVTLHEDGSVFVNGAKVVTPDVLIAGGVAHVIDEVLNPNNTAIAAPTATAGVPEFSGLSSVSTAPFTSGAPAPSGGASSSATGPATASTAGSPAMRTGAIGAAALFGAGVVIAQL